MSNCMTPPCGAILGGLLRLGNVRFGSLAAAPSDNGRGRFTPESGHERSARVRQGLRQMIISHPSIYFWDVGLVES